MKSGINVYQVYLVRNLVVGVVVGAQDASDATAAAAAAQNRNISEIRTESRRSINC